jgi:MSHA biogenesis protein MshM
MYEAYYGLTEKPFSLTPDTDFFFGSDSHQAALETLLVSIREGDGFIKVTGEVGTGKTLLCRSLLQRLDAERFETLYIPNPQMSREALLQAVADELSLQPDPGEPLVTAINRRLLDLARAGRRCVLLLDEAQSLPLESLETVRLLSNLETEKHKLIQLVLLGQPELDRKLSQHGIRQLRQRIVHACRLDSLDAHSLPAYVEHRLRCAGYCGPRLFAPAVLRELYRHSGGVPRLVNLLCHKALLLAYGSASFVVTTRLLRQAAADCEQLGAAA